jgi:hypothetical protein
MNTICTAITHDGWPCRNWAVRDSDPPRCGAHRGGRRPPGAPRGNRNALVHGRCLRTRSMPGTVDALLDDLASHHAFLQAFVAAGRARSSPLVPVAALGRLLILYCRSTTLVSRALGDAGTLSPPAVARLTAAWEQALGELISVDEIAL